MNDNMAEIITNSQIQHKSKMLSMFLSFYLKLHNCQNESQSECLKLEREAYEVL